MSNHKTRAKAACITACPGATCRLGGTCRSQQFDPLLGNMPAWWNYLPDGGEARRCALADALGRQMVATAAAWRSKPALVDQ